MNATNYFLLKTADIVNNTPPAQQRNNGMGMGTMVGGLGLIGAGGAIAYGQSKMNQAANTLGMDQHHILGGDKGLSNSSLLQNNTQNYQNILDNEKNKLNTLENPTHMDLNANKVMDSKPVGQTSNLIDGIKDRVGAAEKGLSGAKWAKYGKIGGLLAAGGTLVSAFNGASGH